MSRNQSPALVAGGNISPMTFVKLATTAGQTGLQAGAGQRTIGISGTYTRLPPSASSDIASSAFHAAADENIELFGLGDICLLKIGSGGCTAGDGLKSDASGLGVTAGTAEFIGAIALQTRLANEFALVQVMHTFADVSAATSVANDVDLLFGTSNDAAIRWSTADASDPSLVLATGDSSNEIHFTKKANRTTDWNITSPANPTLYIHSNTTPITDYLLLGSHDGTTAIMDVVGGTTMLIKASGTTAQTITTASTTFPAGILSTGPTGAGIGYATGAGGAVTQTTSRTTGVTLNTLTGAITTDVSSLAAGAEAEFTVTNSTVAATDTVLVCLKTESATGLSLPFVSTVAAGSFKITLTNLHASTADTSASVINFAVIKAVAS